MPYEQKQSALRKGLKYFDSQPYTIQLNYKNKLDYKSTTGGIISLIFYAAAIIVFAFNLKDFLTQKQYIFQTYLIKNDFSLIALNRSWFGLQVIGCCNSNKQRFNITKQTQQLYGIQIYVEQSFDPNNTNKKTYEAVPCEYNNESIFNFTNFFCFPKQFNLSLQGRSDVISINSNTTIPYHRVAFLVKRNNEINVTQNVQIQIIFAFVNNVTNPQQGNPIYMRKARRFYVRDGEYLAQNQNQQLTFYFQKLQVVTDTGLLFHNYENTQFNFNSTFYGQQMSSSVYTYNELGNHTLAEIKLKRSLYTLKYERHFKKISTFLAESFGIIGLLSFIFFVYKGYNKWSFTEKQLIPTESKRRTNIFMYYWSRIKNIKRMQPNSQIYQQFEHKLDIYKILERLDDYENRLRGLENRSFLQFQEGYEPQHAVKKDPGKSVNKSQAQKQYSHQNRGKDKSKHTYKHNQFEEDLLQRNQ